MGAGYNIAEWLVEGSKLTRKDLPERELLLAKDSEDLHKRFVVYGYYYHHRDCCSGAWEILLIHQKWVIENYSFGEHEGTLLFASENLDEESHLSLMKLWLERKEKTPQDKCFLLAFADYCRYRDVELAESILYQCLALYPEDIAVNAGLRRFDKWKDSYLRHIEVMKAAGTIRSQIPMQIKRGKFCQGEPREF